MSYNVIKRVPGVCKQRRNGASAKERAEIAQDAAMAVRKARGAELLELARKCPDARSRRCLLNELSQIRVPVVRYRPTKGVLVLSLNRPLFAVRA